MTLTTANKNLIKLTSFFLFFIFSINVFGQTDESEEWFQSEFPDTINFVKPNGKKVLSLESIGGQIIDTLINPTGFIVRTSGLYLALKKENYFEVYQLTENPSTYQVDFRRINFDGIGNNELFIKGENTDGRYDRNGGGGFSECLEDFTIWNLDTVKQLAVFTNYYTHQTYDRDSLVEATCFNFIPSIKMREIIFNETKICDEDKEGINNSENGQLLREIKYKLTNNCLIKIK